MRSHGGLRLSRFLIAVDNPRHTRLLAAAIPSVGDGHSERSLGVDHLSSCRSSGARRRTAYRRQQLAESLRRVPQVSYRYGRFSAGRCKE